MALQQYRDGQKNTEIKYQMGVRTRTFISKLTQSHGVDDHLQLADLSGEVILAMAW